MKKFISLVLLIGAFVINAIAQQTDITKVLKFTNDNYDMGKIAFGKPTEFSVIIENISASPVILTNVQVGCGCTTPKFTANSVIAPGAKATVGLGFNGSAVGLFTKSATLFFNDNMVKTVSFHGEGVQQ
jgi:hypothetical protein